MFLGPRHCTVEGCISKSQCKHLFSPEKQASLREVGLSTLTVLLLDTGPGESLYPPTSGTTRCIVLELATRQETSMQRSNRDWNDQSGIEIHSQSWNQAGTASVSPHCFPPLRLTGSSAAWIPDSTQRRHRSSAREPRSCQSASKTRCGSNSCVRPVRNLHGRSLRNGVRFSVHTCSEGTVAYRRA